MATQDISFRMLGRFSISMNGELADSLISKSRKGVALLQLLILHYPEPVPNQKLYELLWPGEKSTHPESALKTLVSRFRTQLGSISPELSSVIVTDRGSYRFEPGAVRVDLLEVRELCAALSRIASPGPADFPAFDRLLSAYHDDLLTGAQSEEWMSAPRITLHNQCYAEFYRYIEGLKEHGQYQDVVYVCRRLLEIDNFDETLQIALMDAMLQKGQVNEAMLQHRHATEVYYKYLGVQPPDAIQDFYRTILNAERSLDDSLSVICAELQQASDSLGAFVCEYAIFKEIYGLQVRSIGRTDLQVFVVLINLQRIDGSPVEAMKLNGMMDRLQEILRTTLRRGDVICRFSASKFALLLPMTSGDGANPVMDRIKKVFYREYGRSDVIISFKVSSVDRVAEIGG